MKFFVYLHTQKHKQKNTQKHEPTNIIIIAASFCFSALCIRTIAGYKNMERLPFDGNQRKNQAE